jgi:hypothetical protein
MNQLEIHKKIEILFKAGVESADIIVAQSLLVNDDSRRFFFSQADASWLDWLWLNGFLDAIKEKAEDSGIFSYNMPELGYLTSMAEKDSAKVTEIILDENTATREEKFNPEVIDRFLRIIATLPAEQIKTLTRKIRDERWVYLMRKFRKTGYDFESTIKKLVEERESSAILELAQAIFAVKSKAEISGEEKSYSTDDPFYVSNLDESGIFEALANIQEPYKEKALQIATGIMKKIVELAEPDETRVFDYMDLFSLYDVDFFTLEIESGRSLSYREDIKKLAATIKKLIEKSIGGQCANASEAKRLFEYINKLPSCRSMWRLKLYALAQCPEVFRIELREAFFKLFEVKNYYEIEGGTEYKKALRVGFFYLSKTDQRDYVNNVFQYFLDKTTKDPDKMWYKRTGWEILSSICVYLEDFELQKCEEVFDKKCDEKYEPEPSVGKSRSGIVRHRPPVNLVDFTIDQIIINIKSEWTVDKMNEKYKDDDFLNPRGVEGLGDALKEDVKKRTNKYLQNINAFFDKDKIHPHYVYSLLRGIEEMLRDGQSFNLAQIGQIFGLFEIIKNEGEKIPFKSSADKSWLADWIVVHRVFTDILLSILGSEEIKKEVQKIHRELIKNFISYLFTIKNSPSKEQEKPEYGDLYNIAINSVRGRTYEVLVVFSENDGKILAKDVKDIYQRILSDDSLAVRFIIGRYLATFYFRDKEFIISLFSEIFPKDNPEKQDVYLASWEGYLSNTLYDKLFVELKNYYSHAITLNPKDYTQRKYSHDLDESLAIHLALAFVHLGLETSDPLFTQFWSTQNVTRHKEFISFIGRSCLSRSQADDGESEENKIDKEKLIKFWGWALENVKEPDALSGFGYWINPDKAVLDDAIVAKKISETLKKSDGVIDWDYGLTRRLSIFAGINGETTFEIITNYLLDSKNDLNQNQPYAPHLYEAEVRNALDIIYKNGDSKLKQKVTGLINTLIEKGSSRFWHLKEVISDDQKIV